MKYPCCSQRNFRLLIILGFIGGSVLYAQDSMEDKITQENAAIMLEALKFRSELVAQISGETEVVPNALERLRVAAYPSGLRIGNDAGFAYAAIDIGQRLVVLGKLEEAALFFTAAENALEKQVHQTTDAHAGEKAEYLRKLALVRGNYLNKPAQAKDDIDAAIQLNPNDGELKRFRRTLETVRGDVFKGEDSSEGGEK